MDKICFTLLSNIKQRCGDGYAIFSLDELAEFFPAEEPISLDDVAAAINYLADEKYIDVKYSRGDMFCVAPLKDLPADDGEIISQVAKAAYEVDDKRLYALCAALSFAGGFLGSFIICLIFAAVG